MSRRLFLKLTAGGAAATAAPFAHKSFNKWIPWVVAPESVRPGEYSHIATTCRECPAGCGMLMRHIDGRAIKPEPNPGHPVNRGGLCPRGQSTVQGQYDPDRLSKIQQRIDAAEQTTDWAAALPAIARTLQPGRVAVISNLKAGIDAELIRQFAARFDSDRVVFYEPFNYQPLRAAHQAVFGRAIVPRYRLDRSRMIVSFATDFLENWISPVEFAAEFAEMHAWRDNATGWFTYVGPRLSMTAANADEMLLVAPQHLLAIATGMLRAIVTNGWSAPGVDVAPLRAMLDRVGPLPDVPGVAATTVTEIARRFATSEGLALAGPTGAIGPAATETAIVAALLNYAVGQIGKAVDLNQPHALSQTASDAEMAQLLAGLGGEDTVFVIDANPAYNLPGAADALRQAGQVVYLGTMRDETAELAHWRLPIDYPIETWGDYDVYAGVHLLMQPTMGRLYDSASDADVLISLAGLAGRPIPAPPGLHAESRPDTGAQVADIAAGAAGAAAEVGETPAGEAEGVGLYPRLRHRWRQLHQQLGGAGDFESFWQNALRAGGVWAEPSGEPVSLSPQVAQTKLETLSTGAGGQLHLWCWPPIMLFDGRVGNRGWLLEAPEPVSYIYWSSWIDIHPDQAQPLGIRSGEVVQVTTPAGQAELACRVTVDVAPGTIAIPFGQGHLALGRFARQAAAQANAFSLLGRSVPDGYFGGVRIAGTGRFERPIYGNHTQSQWRRDILDWVPLSELQKLSWGEPPTEIDWPTPEGYNKHEDIYPPHPHVDHRWAMVIDLDRCIGCGACAVACYAENNIAVVGPENCREGREMAWLKVVPYRHPEQWHRLGFLPMLCQHCDAAPCEPVCPVYAAVHNEEGLNAQVYNRCIGTRYCNNNCPYKVRRFNWVNIDWDALRPLNWQLNPQVSVRCRGVMEKCTFCVQRIREAEYRARRQNRPLRPGEIVPACMQTCPTGVLSFGDLKDPASEVYKRFANDPRRYQVLFELNTKPAIVYLRRIERGK